MDKLTECKHCHRGSCYEQHIDENTVTRLCMACGFQTNTIMTEGSAIVNNILESAPELYKDLMFKDDSGHIWFPATVTVPEKGMVFLDGSTAENWKWAAVKAIPIEKKEKKKFPKGQTHKMDTVNKQYFEQNEFIVCMDFIELFS